MLHEFEFPYLRETLAFLIATVVVVPLCHRLKTSPVLGYLAAGAVIGPYGLALVENVEGVRALAQLGIVFLLFTVGLELSPDRLWALRRYVFGLGGTQVVLTAASIAAIAWAWGNAAPTALVLGGCLALSSTAIVLQLLIERGELASRLGRAVFSVLLFQDLAVVPLLLFVNLFAAAGTHPLLTTLGFALGRAVLAIGAVLIFGRLILRPLFRIAAKTSGSEVFVAMALLAILGTAVVTGVSGLSMALGAFLAGLLIAESEYRHQIEIEIQPFRGLLLGLFFMSVGMGIDFLAVADQALWIAASVFGLIALKAALAGGLARLFGLPAGEAVRAGLILGAGGEFAFVVVGAALAVGLMPARVGQFMLIVAGVTMLLTPLLDVVGRALNARLARRAPVFAAGDLEAASGDLVGHVVIAGFGRVGRMVARFLDEQKVPFIALDRDGELVATYRRLGMPVFFGDSSRTRILDRVGLDRAAAAVVTLNDPADTMTVIEALRARQTELPIFVRTRDARHAEDLVARGANHAVPETVESSLQLGGLVLQTLGTPREAVDGLIDQIREAEYANLRAAARPASAPPAARSDAESEPEDAPHG